MDASPHARVTACVHGLGLPVGLIAILTTALMIDHAFSLPAPLVAMSARARGGSHGVGILELFVWSAQEQSELVEGCGAAGYSSRSTRDW